MFSSLLHFVSTFSLLSQPRQGFCTKSTLAVGMARLGQSTQKVCITCFDLNLSHILFSHTSYNCSDFRLIDTQYTPSLPSSNRTHQLIRDLYRKILLIHFIWIAIAYQIVFGTIEQLLQVDFGPPLHSLALCGETHPLESEVRSFLSRESR